MTACTLLDIPCHLNNLLFGWVALVPWWGWAAAGLVLVGIVWKIAGWPGLLALVGAAGFILGRRSAESSHENVDGTDASTPFRTKRTKRTNRTKPALKGNRRFDPDTNTWVDK